MTPEFELVVQTCRWAFARDGEDRIERIASAVDWPLVLALARRHRVEALVWNCIENIGLGVSPGVRDGFESDATRIVAKNLLVAGECASIRQSLEGADVPVLFVKGLSLAALAYRDPFLKSGWDIDLLVPSEQVESAAEVLSAAGYRPVTPASRAKLRNWHAVSKESLWYKAGAGFHLELHSRLADNERLIPDVGMASPHQHVEVAPKVVLPTLALHHLFAYLCVHGASSAWFRLKWIADLAALLHGRSDREVDGLYRSAQQLGAGRSADQALLLASALFGTIQATPLLARLRRDPVSRWLARTALRQLAGPRSLEEPTERPLGTAAIHVSQLFLQPGIAFKGSELTRQVRHSLLGFGA